MEEGSTFLISEIFPEIYYSLILLFLSGFFSSSETALFSITRDVKKKMRDSNTLIDRVIDSLLKRPKVLLITILFGNMFVNVAFFCVCYGIAKNILHTNSNNASLWAGITSVASLLILIIFGEVIPKNVAVRIPLQISKLFAIPILIFQMIFLPFQYPLAFITDKISSLFTTNKKEEKNITVDELKMIVEMGEKEGIVDETEHSMIDAVLDFQEKQVKSVMIPRVDMATYNVADSPEGFLALVRKTKLTKIPVYSNNPDTIIGTVHAKDVFLNPGVVLREFVRQILFIPESKTIESLLRKFRKDHRQIAIIIDEYGGTAGLVTLEDILEEIVGDIEDEHDNKEDDEIYKIDDNKFHIAGNLDINEWCNYFEIELESPDFDTISGFVISLFGDIPKKGDSTEYGNIKFTVDKIRRRRIIRLSMEIGSKKSE